MVSDDKPKVEQSFVWTVEQVVGLAPDKYHIRTSRGFAVPEKWTQLGRTQDLIWGVFPNKGKPSLYVTVHLTHLSLGCTCKSRKYPCNHLLSILLLYAESPESFVTLPLPEKLAERVNLLDGSPQANRKSTAKKRTSDSKRRNQRRRQNISAGLLELELWLHDMIENGLAAVQDYPKTYWTAMADRLVDYQVGEIGYQIRAMGQLPGKAVDWHETLLKQISQLYLLVQGFKRYDDLPLATQMDLRMAVGWLPRPDEVDPNGDENGWETVTDRWLVLGKRTELRGKQTLQRTWLWGQQTNRPALLLDIVSKSRQQLLTHIVGSTIDAALHFAPTTTRLYALVANDSVGASSANSLTTSSDVSLSDVPLQFERRQSDRFVTGYGSVHEAVSHYRNAITQNPWLRYTPVVLNNVTIDAVAVGATVGATAGANAGPMPRAQVDRTNGRWGVRDLARLQDAAVQKAVKNDGPKAVADDHTYLLPLPQKFEHLWYLRSLSHHQPLAIFGEWNGEVLTPLGIWHDDRLLAMRVLGGSI